MANGRNICGVKTSGVSAVASKVERSLRPRSPLSRSRLQPTPGGWRKGWWLRPVRRGRQRVIPRCAVVLCGPALGGVRGMAARQQSEGSAELRQVGAGEGLSI